MTTFEPTPFLRRVLLADAILAGGAGLFIALLASALEPWLLLPSTLLLAAGLGFIVFAVLVAMVARSRTPLRAAVWAIIVVNAVCALECVGVLVTGMVSPSPLGIAFILALMLVMAVFAILEYVGLRQSSRTTDLRAPVPHRS